MRCTRVISFPFSVVFLSFRSLSSEIVFKETSRYGIDKRMNYEVFRACNEPHPSTNYIKYVLHSCTNVFCFFFWRVMSFYWALYNFQSRKMAWFYFSCRWLLINARSWQRTLFNAKWFIHRTNVTVIRCSVWQDKNGGEKKPKCIVMQCNTQIVW